MKPLSALLVSLLGAAMTVAAAPVPYTFDFTGDVPRPVASFQYDSTAVDNPFSAYIVTFGGDSFDLTDLANSASVLCPGATSGAHSLFNSYMGDTPPGCVFGRDWVAFQVPIDPATHFTRIRIGIGSNEVVTNAVFPGPGQFIPDRSGQFTVTEANVSVPEPATILLVVCGGGALWAGNRRRRNPVLYLHGKSRNTLM